MCTPLQCFVLCFLALNLLIIDSSLDMHAECCIKTCNLYLIYLAEKLQGELEHHTFHKDLGFFETSTNVRMVQTYSCPGFVLVVLADSQPSPSHK